MRDKRTSEGYKLRVYMDAIKQAKETSEVQWLNNWMKNPNAPWISQNTWIAYLEHCAIGELEKIYIKMAA